MMSNGRFPKAAAKQKVVQLWDYCDDDECMCCTSDCDCECHDTENRYSENVRCRDCCKGVSLDVAAEDVPLLERPYIKVQDTATLRACILFIVDSLRENMATLFRNRRSPEMQEIFYKYLGMAVPTVAAYLKDSPDLYPAFNQPAVIPSSWVIAKEAAGHERIMPNTVRSAYMSGSNAHEYNSVTEFSTGHVTNDLGVAARAMTEQCFGNDVFPVQDCKWDLMDSNTFPDVYHVWAFFFILLSQDRARDDDPDNYKSTREQAFVNGNTDSIPLYEIDFRNLQSAVANDVFSRRAATSQIHFSVEQVMMKEDQVHMYAMACVGRMPLVIPLEAMENETQLINWMERLSFDTGRSQREFEADRKEQERRIAVRRTFGFQVTEPTQYRLYGPAHIEGIHFNVTPETKAKAESMLVNLGWKAIAEVFDSALDPYEDRFLGYISGYPDTRDFPSRVMKWERFRKGTAPTVVRVGNIFLSASPALTYHALLNSLTTDVVSTQDSLVTGIQIKRATALLHDYEDVERDLTETTKSLLALRARKAELQEQIRRICSFTAEDVNLALAELNSYTWIEHVELLPSGTVIVQTNDLYYQPPEVSGFDDEDETDNRAVPSQFYIGQYQIALSLVNTDLAIRNIATPLAYELEYSEPRLRMRIHPHMAVPSSQESHGSLCLGSFHSELEDHISTASNSVVGNLRYRLQLLYDFLATPDRNDLYVRAWAKTYGDKPDAEYMAVSPWKDLIGNMAPSLSPIGTRRRSKGSHQNMGASGSKLLALKSQTSNPKFDNIVAQVSNAELDWHRIPVTRETVLRLEELVHVTEGYFKLNNISNESCPGCNMLQHKCVCCKHEPSEECGCCGTCKRTRCSCCSDCESSPCKCCNRCLCTPEDCECDDDIEDDEL